MGQLASTTSWVAIDAVTFRGFGGRAATFQLASTTSWVAIDAVNIFEKRLNAFFLSLSSLDIASLDIASLDSASLDSANLDILESGHFAHSTFRTFYLLSGHSTFLIETHDLLSQFHFQFCNILRNKGSDLDSVQYYKQTP